MGNIELSRANDYALFLLNIYNLLPALLPVDVAAATASAPCAEAASTAPVEATTSTCVVTSARDQRGKKTSSSLSGYNRVFLIFATRYGVMV